ncbi:MAG: alpha/beta hydrolase [FCB group bacterium]|nr:alpha/beta hydrolase [FCB group bacterium]
MAKKKKISPNQSRGELKDPGSRSVKIVAISALIVTALLYTGIVILFFFTQERYVFSPQTKLTRYPDLLGLKYEDVELKTDDHVTLNGWYLPNENSNRVILYCHGNAGNISDRLDHLKLFHDLGFNIFIFDYRGFGKSTGRITERGTYYDAAMAWQYLRLVRNFKSENIIIYGRSLGASVAAWLAAQQNPSALIIESAFISIQALGTKLYPFLPVSLLTRYSYDTREYLKRVNCPVLVIHSDEDEIIPFTHGKDLFKNISGKKMFLKISGSHNSGYKTYEGLYVKGIQNFFNRFFPSVQVIDDTL